MAIIRKLLTIFVLVSIMAGVAYAGGYGFWTPLFKQEATLQAVVLGSTLAEFEFETSCPSPGENVSFTYIGWIEHNIQPGAIGSIEIRDGDGSYFVSSPYPEAIKELHVKGTIEQCSDEGCYYQTFDGDLLNGNNYTPIKGIITPEGRSRISIEGYCQYGLVKDDTDIDLRFEYIIYDAYDIDEPDEPVEPYITVLWPNGGETLVPGETYNITWESNGIDELSIEWQEYDSYDGGTIDCGEIAYQIPASTGVYSWQVPLGHLGDCHRIIIWDDSITVFPMYDESDGYFSIAEPTHPDEECWIFIAGNSTHIVADSPLIVDSITDRVVNETLCRVDELIYDGWSVVSIKIAKTPFGQALVLTDEYGDERTLNDPPFGEFTIVYETIENPEIFFIDDVTVCIVEGGMG